MAARVARHMSLARASILVFIVVALLTTLFMIKMTQGEALPAGPTDATAGTPLLRTLDQLGPEPADAAGRHGRHHSGDGTGATATATVGGNGAVTGITITNPGSGYTHGAR